MTNEELKQFVTINGDDLENDCINLSDQLVHIYTLFSEADNAYNVYSEAVNAAYAGLYLTTRAELSSSGGKATESLIENTVKANEQYIDMVEKKYRLKKQRDFLYGLLQGMSAKREMVKTLSFLRREDKNY